jgi:PTS system mannose-specific IIC component
MFLIQSILVGILCWWASNTAPCYGFTFGWYTLGRPLIGGFICGIIFGDVAQGILLGAAIQVVYLALVTPGGSFPVDLGFISYPAMAIAIISDMEPGMAVAMGSTVGVLGTFAITFFRTFAAVFNNMEDKYIEKCDYKGILRTFIIYPQIMGFLIRAVPAFLAVYFGAQYVGDFIKSLPVFVTTALMALGGILPAVGVAVLLTQSVRKKTYIIFFLVGFICIAFLNLNIIALTVVGSAIALLYYRSEGVATSTSNAAMTRELEEVL